MKNKPNDINYLAELTCRLTRYCNEKEDHFAQSFNLTPTQVRLLILFSFEKSYTIKELKSILNLTSGRITQLIISLEEKKLIERFIDTKDRRNKSIRALPKANSFITNLKDSYSQLHKDLLKNVGSEDIEKIFESLQILVETFRLWTQDK